MYKIVVGDPQYSLFIEYSKIDSCLHHDDACVVRRLIEFVKPNTPAIEQRVMGVQYHVQLVA